MDRLKVSIMEIFETRWQFIETFKSNQYSVYYSANKNPLYKNEVGVILKESISTSMVKFLPISDRIMFIHLHSNPVYINFIQIYTYTANKDKSEKEEYYQQINEPLKITKTNIMGDIDAKVGTTRKFG